MIRFSGCGGHAPLDGRRDGFHGLCHTFRGDAALVLLRYQRHLDFHVPAMVCAADVMCSGLQEYLTAGSRERNLSDLNINHGAAWLLIDQDRDAPEQLLEPHRASEIGQ